MRRPTQIPPLALFVHHHFELLNLLSKGNSEVDSLAKLLAEQHEAMTSLRDAQDKIEREGQQPGASDGARGGDAS